MRAHISIVTVPAALSWVLAGGCGGNGGEPPTPSAELTAVTTGGGESAVKASHPGGGEAWSATTELVVPEGAEQLLVASVPGVENAALTGVTVMITSPDGAQRIAMGDGALTIEGLTEADLGDAALDAELEAWIAALRAELPASLSEADLHALAARLGVAEPDAALPTLPADLGTRLDAFLQTLRALDSTVPRRVGARTPSEGLLVFGPAAGRWRVSVEADAGAGAFELRLLALPEGLDLAAIDHLAGALAGASSGALSAALETGTDPGCDRTVDGWRHPAPSNPTEWERAMLLRAAWTTLTLFFQAGAAALATVTIMALIPEESVAVVASIFLLGPETFVAIVSAVSGVIFQALTDFDNVAEDYFWRFAFTWWTPQNYGTVCAFGLPAGAPMPPFRVAPGDLLRTEVTVLNALSRELPYEGWGYGVAGNPRALSWASSPSGVVKLDPDGATHHTVCELLAEEDPTDDTTTVTVTMETQPARRDFEVEIGERTCRVEDRVIAQGEEIIVRLEASPPIPDDWTVEYQWNQVGDDAGELTSPATGAPAPFTTDGPEARYTAGEESGVDYVAVEAKRTEAGAEPRSLCEAVGEIEVVPELTLSPQSSRLALGQSVELRCQACETLQGSLVFAWETGGVCGVLRTPQGGLQSAFETTTYAPVTYHTRGDAPDPCHDVVTLTVYEVDVSMTRTAIGVATATVDIGASAAACDVTLVPYDAPVGWVSEDGNPNDVECELGTGLHVLDPSALGGCLTYSECQGRCEGWSDGVEVGVAFGWELFDADGESRGSAGCSSGPAAPCESAISWMQHACSDNLCGFGEDATECSPCNCGCGSSSGCYPWRGPGKIVFHAATNMPCTDIADCFYHNMPSRVTGGVSFRVVGCNTIDNALPNCPGNVPP